MANEARTENRRSDSRSATMARWRIQQAEVPEHQRLLA